MDYSQPSSERFQIPQEVFNHELSKIRSGEAKTTIIAMLKVCPAEFWFGPSSLSGKYHSPDEAGMGGQILHTKRVFRQAMVLLDSLAKEVDSEGEDEIMCAALIHDTLAGSTGSSDHVSQYRSYYEEKLPDGIKKLNWWEGICDVAEHHMGRWPPNNHPGLYPKWYSAETGEDDICPAYDWILHLSDMTTTKVNGMPILKEHDYNLGR